MAEQNSIERLDAAIDAALRGSQPAVDPEMASMLAIATDLRDLPSPQFRSRLRAELVPPRRGFHTITPYLIVEDASGLIDFLQRAFGGEENLRVPRPNTKRIMHAEVKVGDSMIELADAAEQREPMASAIHLYVDDVDAVHDRAVKAGATPLYAPMNQPYGDRESAVRDRWGNHWYIAASSNAATRPFPLEGFHTVTPYLIPRGAGRLAAFLRQAFDATDIAPAVMSPDGTVMHAEMRIGDSIIEMGEAHGQWQPMPMSIHLYVGDADAVYERALQAGATSNFPPRDMPYGERSGAVIDPFGNYWFVATPK
jgi:PhnB protein